MAWAAIISALLSIFGPLLLDWLKKWLDSRMVEAAARLPAAETFGSPELARAALFDEVIADLPRFAFGRRALLRRMKATAADGTMTADEAAEMKGLAELAAHD